MSDRDLIAEARELLRAPNVSERDLGAWCCENLPVLLIEIKRARARIAELEAERAALITSPMGQILVSPLLRRRHSWECANRTKIGVPELDSCECPEMENPEGTR